MTKSKAAGFWLSAFLWLSFVPYGKSAVETVELMGAKASWIDTEWVGHAFLTIAYPLNNGIKEESFGFYPKQGVGFVGHPGAINSEFVKNPTRFSRVTVSIKKSVTAEQRLAVLKLANEWNGKGYHLTNNNCIDFVRSVAQAIGLNVPPRLTTDLPESYMKKLKQANP